MRFKRGCLLRPSAESSWLACSLARVLVLRTLRNRVCVSVCVCGWVCWGFFFVFHSYFLVALYVLLVLWLNLLYGVKFASSVSKAWMQSVAVSFCVSALISSNATLTLKSVWSLTLALANKRMVNAEYVCVWVMKPNASLEHSPVPYATL